MVGERSVMESVKRERHMIWKHWLGSTQIRKAKDEDNLLNEKVDVDQLRPFRSKPDQQLYRGICS